MKKQLYYFVLCSALMLSVHTSYATAELQVIHNCSDPNASSVDVYVNGTLALDDFAFRTATPFISLPSNTMLDIGIAPANSSSAADTLVNFSVMLDSAQRYVAIASGVLNPQAFAANPDGRNTGFSLLLEDNIRNVAMMSNEVDFIGVHGSTDASTVDILARNVASLIDNAAYGDITGYLSVPPASYILDVTPGSDNTTIVASFMADLSALAGGSAVVFASGFLDPSMNQNGPAFGLWAALANGTVVELPATSMARLQIIHNAADPAAQQVDVYVNGNLAIDDFAFRAATPFFDVPADVLLNIGIAPSTSTSVNDTLKNFQVTFANAQTYVAIANGVLNSGNFAANPEGRNIDFTLFLQNNMREAALGTDVDIRVVHGCTDAPAVDVVAIGAGIIVDNALYSDITPYFSVPASLYTLQVTPAADNSTVVASFIADLNGLGGGAAVVFASGFLNPLANQNGQAFGLFAALPNGTVVEFTNNTGIEEENVRFTNSIYPNPATDKIAIPLFAREKDEISVSVYDASGRLVMEQNRPLSGSMEITFDISKLEAGVYALTVGSGNAIIHQKLTVVR